MYFVTVNFMYYSNIQKILLVLNKSKIVPNYTVYNRLDEDNL